MRPSQLLPRGVAVVAAACALVGAAAGTAGAAPARATTAAADAVTITIGTASKIPKVTGDTLVIYAGTGHSNRATVSGSVTGAKGGRATLLAEIFGAHQYTAVGRPVSLPASKSPYSFAVTPALATSYEVQVTGKGVPTTVSAPRTVYVALSGTVTGKTSCTRPVCHITEHIWVSLPPATYQAEASKHWYLYSRLALAPVREPPAPRVLELNTKATASKALRRHDGQFEVTVRFTFRIGNDAYRWRVDYCTRDTEAVDGLGLPGHHGCGIKWIKVPNAYLG
jgi:hypothetical protein